MYETIRSRFSRLSITPTKVLKKLCDVDKINKDTLDGKQTKQMGNSSRPKESHVPNRHAAEREKQATTKAAF